MIATLKFLHYKQIVIKRRPRRRAILNKNPIQGNWHTCLVINCRSLKNKIADINEYKTDVILANKSWLNSEIANSEIFLEGYTVFRKDRIQGQIGGGVFQAILKVIL